MAKFIPIYLGDKYSKYEISKSDFFFTITNNTLGMYLSTNKSNFEELTNCV